MELRGKAKEKFASMIKWQNGDVSYIEVKEKLKAINRMASYKI